MSTRAVQAWSYTIEQMDAMDSGTSLIDEDGNSYEKRGRAWWRGEEQVTARQLAKLRFIAAIEPLEEL